MFEFGILSDEISQDFDHALDVIRELGASHVELRNLWDKGILQLSDPELSRAKALIDKSGLKVSAIAAPLFKIPLSDEPAYQEHLQSVESYIALSRDFGTDKVRVFGFMRDGELTENVLREIADKLGPAIEKAEAAGVVLVLENEHQTFIGNAASSRRLLDSHPSKHLGLIWDPGNAYRTGETPYPDGYSLVRDRTVHFHIKDATRIKNGEYVWRPVGGGEVDLEGQLRALQQDRYEGVVVLETHYVPPGGSKEDGTRESWDGLRRLLESIGAGS